MANRCENEIIIDGPADDVLRIKKYIKKESFFNNFCKKPKNANRYDRRINNRWCKRDTWKKMMNCCEYEEYKNRGTLTLLFDTALSPPYEAMYYLAIHNPKVSIELRYSEWGMWFSGEAKRSDWERQYHNEYDDSYFGEWQECSQCHWIYWPHDEERWDPERTICHRCRKDLQDKIHPWE